MAPGTAKKPASPANSAPRLFLLFNHPLSSLQEADARQRLGVGGAVPLPPHLRKRWAQIPPDLPSLREYLEPLAAWLLAEARPGDFVLIQGDFGASYLMVELARQHGLIPVYATTRRAALEEPQPDGSIRVTRRFEHQIFRRYGA